MLNHGSRCRVATRRHQPARDGHQPASPWHKPPRARYQSSCVGDQPASVEDQPARDGSAMKRPLLEATIMLLTATAAPHRTREQQATARSHRKPAQRPSARANRGTAPAHIVKLARAYRGPEGFGGPFAGQAESRKSPYFQAFLAFSTGRKNDQTSSRVVLASRAFPE
jgi:hypothetical protein